MTEHKDKTVKKVKRVKKKKKTNKNLILAIVIVLLVIIFAGVFLYANYLEKQRAAELEKIAEQQVETVLYGDEALGIDPKVDEQLQGYRNILFLGTDNPDEGTDVSRSDGIVIISINQESKDVKIFSIARDTYMEIEPDNYEKITHAYMNGGMDQTLWALNHTLDLNIREAVAFDWDAVANVVDRLGGVEIEFTDTERIEMNNGLSYEDQLTTAGTQLLNGRQAVMYSRIRKDVPTLSDFRRNERLKIVLTEALNKAKALETEELIIFAEETLDDVKTNMRSDKIIELAEAAQEFTIVKSDETFPFKFKGWTTDATGRVFVPITLESNVSTLHQTYFGQENYKPSETVQQLSTKYIETTNIGAN